MEKIIYSVVSKKRAHDMLGIYIRCEQFNRITDINTGVRVFSDEWDDVNGRVVGNPNFRELNLYIRKTLYGLEELELGYKGDFTLGKLKEIWEGKNATFDFYAMMTYQIEHRDIREGTKGIHRRVLVHLKKYKEKCNISDLTEDYVRGFIKYMKSVHHNQTTQRTMLNVLKCYYNIARRLFGEKVPSDTFDFYHVTQEQQIQFHLKPLSEEDVRKIENYIANPSTPTKHVITLERFLFMVYTGVRISDFITLTKNNFTMEGQEMWLTYTSVKTDTYVRLPISTVFDSRAEQLVHKYQGRMDEFFGDTQKDAFNARLKVACKHAGVTKNVSAHVARHTFASRLINKDVPITTIQQVIGHRSLKMTMVYARTSEQTLIRQLS